MEETKLGRGLRLILAILLIVAGLASGGGGLWLITLGGSWYYLLAGLVLIAAGVLLLRRRREALWLYAALVLATLAWSLWEAGLDWWAMVPRGDVIFVLGALLLLPAIGRALGGWRRAAGPLALSLILAGATGVAAMARSPHDHTGTAPSPRLAKVANYGGVPDDDWTAYGRSWRGNKWSPLDQLTPANAGKLKEAWTLHTGDLRRPGDPEETTYEVTPIKVGGALYLCTPHNHVLAVDAETGQVLWRFDPHVQVRGSQHMSCRGVSWWDAAKAGVPAPADCPQRLFMATNDSRLVALDPRTGRLCASFGQGGQIPLWPGMPDFHEGWYQFTSAPLVARGLVVLAGAIYDNVSVNAPSGVIRAFDAVSGRLVWNFDPGNPGDTAPLGPGQHYSFSSPNSWSTSAVDEALGLIYVPMGNGAVDQFGGHRPATTERFGSSVLALDIDTGQARWVYQTVHHDLWDMDVPAQPALVDLDLPGRGMVPALVQSTKTGNLFVLDRRTGQPVLPAPERPVPQGAAPGDWTSPTQPFALANLRPERNVRESDMWGPTLFDQLACRIAFRSLRYEGPFTPPSTKGTLVFPGNFGVLDWGGVSIDPQRQIAFANPSYMAFVDKLLPRRTGAEDTRQGGPSGGSDRGGSSEKGYNPNAGAPYAVALNPFLSKIGLPCQAPPWGYVAAVDLTTGKTIYKRPNGTIRDEAPVPLPFKLGVPSLGGPMTTAGGLAFLTSTLDYYIRAYDVTTGKVVWQSRLPAGGQATPMTYRSPVSGRQFVVAVAGGHGSLETKEGDSIIAYALPR